MVTDLTSTQKESVIFTSPLPVDVVPEPNGPVLSGPTPGSDSGERPAALKTPTEDPLVLYASIYQSILGLKQEIVLNHFLYYCVVTHSIV